MPEEHLPSDDEGSRNGVALTGLTTAEFHARQLAQVENLKASLGGARCPGPRKAPVPDHYLRGSAKALELIRRAEFMNPSETQFNMLSPDVRRDVKSLPSLNVPALLYSADVLNIPNWKAANTFAATLSGEKLTAAKGKKLGIRELQDTTLVVCDDLAGRRRASKSPDDEPEVRVIALFVSNEDDLMTTAFGRFAGVRESRRTRASDRVRVLGAPAPKWDLARKLVARQAEAARVPPPRLPSDRERRVDLRRSRYCNVVRGTADDRHQGYMWGEGVRKQRDGSTAAPLFWCFASRGGALVESRTGRRHS